VEISRLPQQNTQRTWSVIEKIIVSPHSALLAEAQKRLSANASLSLEECWKNGDTFQFIYCPTWSGDFLAELHSLFYILT
jgi:hypothetical protein